MKWIIVISLFCLSFSFLYSFINKSNLDLSNNSESFYEYSSVTIDGEEFKMSNLKGKKVIIVNRITDKLFNIISDVEEKKIQDIIFFFNAGQLEKNLIDSQGGGK